MLQNLSDYVTELAYMNSLQHPRVVSSGGAVRMRGPSCSFHSGRQWAAR